MTLRPEDLLLPGKAIAAIIAAEQPAQTFDELVEKVERMLILASAFGSARTGHTILAYLRSEGYHGAVADLEQALSAAGLKRPGA